MSKFVLFDMKTGDIGSIIIRQLRDVCDNESLGGVIRYHRSERRIGGYIIGLGEDIQEFIDSRLLPIVEFWKGRPLSEVEIEISRLLDLGNVQDEPVRFYIDP